MKRRDLEKALLVLETTPFVYEKVVLSADATLRRRIVDLLWEAVAIEENVWALRIRLLRGEDPMPLPQLDREAVRRTAAGKSGAREAVATFLRLRRDNAKVLRGLKPGDENRKQRIEGGRWFSLADLPGVMAEQDQCALRELARRIVTPSGHDCREPSPALAAV